MLIAVVTYFHALFWAQSSPFYHLTYMLDQSIRRKANEGTQSWPQARRNGKVWASDLFRPGVYFQPSFKHCEKLNTLPNSASLNFFICEMGFRRSVLGTENNACKMHGPLPGLAWDCQGCQSLLWSIVPGDSTHYTVIQFSTQEMSKNKQGSGKSHGWRSLVGWSPWGR